MKQVLIIFLQIWPDPPILLSNTTIEEEQPEHVIEGTPTIRKIKK